MAEGSPLRELSEELNFILYALQAINYREPPGLSADPVNLHIEREGIERAVSQINHQRILGQQYTSASTQSR
jgi:hypothetical protein